MFPHEAKQFLINIRPRCLDNSKNKLFTLYFKRQLPAGVKLDAFQRAVIVFTIVLCRRRRRRRPCCVMSLLF